MRVLIVSDTHRKNENYFKALELVKPQLVIHCGDAEGSEYALSEAADCPVQIVLGNNDFFSYLPNYGDIFFIRINTRQITSHRFAIS